MIITGIYNRVSMEMRGNGLAGKALTGFLWKKNSSGVPTARFPDSRLAKPLSPQIVMGGLTPEQLDTHLDMILSPKKLGEAVVNEILSAASAVLNKLFARLSESQLEEMVPGLDGKALAKLLPRLNELQLRRTVTFVTDEQMVEVGRLDSDRFGNWFQYLPVASKARLFSELADKQLSMLQTMEDSQIGEMIALIENDALKRVCCQVGNDRLVNIIQLLPDDQILRVVSAFPTEARMIETLASKNMPAATTDHVLGLIKAKDEGLYCRAIFAMVQKEKA